MNRAYLVANWSLGVVFVILAIASLASGDAWPAVPLLIIALVLLPPVRNFIYSKTNFTIKPMARFAVVSVLFAIFGVAVGNSQDRKTEELAAQKAAEVAKIEAEKTAQKRQADIAYFNANSSVILAAARSASQAGEYQKVMASTTSYIDAGNPELVALNTRAKAALDAQEKAEQEKQRIAKERREKVEKQFSAWDGSHRGVEAAIKTTMHNPKSYEHVETRFTDRGDHLTITTQFRGTNGFGGVVTNSVRAKVDLNGEVLSLVKD